MKQLPLLYCLACLPLSGAEPHFSDVFVSGADGYVSIRIPAVVVSKRGTVLAFAEGRQKAMDQAENDIILKRSTDAGTTWGGLQLIQDDGANSLNNPTAVVTSSGRIILIYQRIPAHLKERSKTIETGYEGDNIYRTLVVTSEDDGATWSKPKDVNRETKRPTLADTVASGPGIGIQLTRGAHKGRILIPFNQGPYHKWNNYAIYSDDNGVTWKCGDNVPNVMIPDAKLGEKSRVNEVQIAELSDGSIALNSRQHDGSKVRKVSVSQDGGQTWAPVTDAPELTDPSCMASLFRYSFDDAKGLMLYSGPDSASRANGTVRLSPDDARSWPAKKVLWPGGFAYSVLTKLADGRVGCLFEADDYKRCVFATFTTNWVVEK
jgi:sialidase-1